LQSKEQQTLKEKEIELLESEDEQLLKWKKLLQLEEDLSTRANGLEMKDIELKRRQEKLNTTLIESMQKETELNNRENELDMNKHKVQTTYYAAKLGRAIGMKNLRTLIGRDEGSDLILPLVEPKNEVRSGWLCNLFECMPFEILRCT
jgi:hypothetical protein